MVVLLSVCQGIEIIPIDEGNGFLTLHENRIPQITHYDFIIHRINISQIEEEFFNYIEHIDRTSTINSKIDQIKTLLNIYSRDKRGLFNAFGELANFLFGVMDSKDKKTIHEMLKINEVRMATMSDNLNSQIHLNENINLEFSKLSQTINKNFKTMNENLNQIKSHTNMLSVYLSTKIRNDETFFHLQIVYNFLHRIIQAIMAAHNNIIDVSLLNDNEISQLHLNQLEFFKINTYHKNKIILIFIQVPIFTNDQCDIVRLYSIPNFKNKQIINLPSKIIKCKNKIYNEDFQAINDKCTEELFEPQIKNCQYIANNNTYVIGDEEGVIISVNLPRIELIHNCNTDKIYIKGTNIIRFKNCTVTLKNESFVNKWNDVNFRIMNNEIKAIEPLKINITFKEISETHLETIKKIDVLQFTNRINMSTNIVSFIFIIIITIALYYLYMNSRESIQKEGRVIASTGIFNNNSLPSVGGDSIQSPFN